eukprot:XP_001706455.1 Hypothetical protein GL50803_37529 [Giardia lamblia ATCC 50803]
MNKQGVSDNQTGRSPYVKNVIRRLKARVLNSVNKIIFEAFLRAVWKYA